MATKFHMLVVAALVCSCSALAANARPAAMDKDVAAAFEDALKEEQPLLKQEEMTWPQL